MQVSEDHLEELLQAVRDANSPYSMGYAAAAVPPEYQPKCPFSRSDRRADEWWFGYNDWTDDTLYYQASE